MNRTPPRHGNQRRRATGTRAVPGIWQEATPLPDLEPVSPASDATALLRSLGDLDLEIGVVRLQFVSELADLDEFRLPLAGTTDISLHFAIVIERAAALAAALALSADLLADGES